MSQGIKLSGYAKTSAKLVAIITAFQIFLGIATLLLQAPEGLAARTRSPRRAALRRGLACV